MARFGSIAGVLMLGAGAFALACEQRFPSASTDDAGALGEGGFIEGALPAIVPPAGRKNASSSAVVFDALRGVVWTANGDVGTISLVDVEARRALQEISVGRDIRSIALSPDGVWVAAVDRLGARVTLIDAETRMARIHIPLGPHPRGCVWDAANPRWLYVALEEDGAVAVVDRTLGRVAATIGVGRLPAGIAVSATRRELYVTHRIDGVVTIVDLHDRIVAADVNLSDEPFSARGVPNGKPFGFESLALTPDGLHAWIPHELLAPTHPFVFNQTLFPAMSVVDLVGRQEQQTDPNDAAGRIAGRKNLFDAINIPGPDGQPAVISELCGVAMHPNGGVAWAIACASEDLVTFGVAAGVATDLLRALPGDHPIGLALDDTGQRLFVMNDQSHTLLTLDTADGSLVQHTTPYGAPIPLVAQDTSSSAAAALDCAGGVDDHRPCPPDADLRAGLKLFFRANSSKGPLPTTGNNWMSCNGCHLDGFGSNNLRLFEALTSHDPVVDAQIGHAGLVDHFSTAPGYAQPTFNPHDILAALIDQGGLVPDRSGASRAGQVDPAAPSVEARQMAERLARVIARDLPQGPSWLVSSGKSPNLSWDRQFCGDCHKAEYAAWSKSVHAHAAEDPMVLYGVRVEQQLKGPQFSRLCAGCHDPVSVRADPPDISFQSRRGVTCLGCHDVDHEIRAGGNGDLGVRAHDWAADHKAWASASLEKLRQPEFCGGCHQQFVPGTGLTAISTLDEFHASPFAATTSCVACHMPKDPAGIADHHFPGGNIHLGHMFGDAALVKAQTENLRGACEIEARRVTGGVLVTVHNRGAGHAFPTGVADIREAWVELQTKPSSLPVAGPGADGLVPPGASRLGLDIARDDGGILYKHELTEATRVPFDTRVPSGGAQAVLISLSQSASPPTPLDVVLYYRNVRTTYYRAATGDANGAAEAIELARVTVP